MLGAAYLPGRVTHLPPCRSRPFVMVLEEPEGKLGSWHRSIGIRIMTAEAAYTFVAEAGALAMESAETLGEAAIDAPDFAPLGAEHEVQIPGQAPRWSTERAPSALVQAALGVCRLAAKRLLAHRVYRDAVSRPWPPHQQPFAAIVLGGEAPVKPRAKRVKYRRPKRPPRPLAGVPPLVE
jgi:hypothetical protein